jgi:phenylacetic acid degradation operon negative regulatory protein
MPSHNRVTALLDQFHAKTPVRAWSLIVTLYGDAIVPRGGSLWLGSLTEIMALFRIDAGHVRTAMSRLTADGWLDRKRLGRNSYYRLSKRGEGEFAAATQRIYFPSKADFDGRLRLALLGPGVGDRAALRPALERGGFAPLSPTAYIALQDASAGLSKIEGLFLLSVAPGKVGPAMAAVAWQLSPLAAAYNAFIKRFSPLAEGLAKAAARPSDALIARILLIHEFRRLVLRDPGLPADLLPTAWPEEKARALAAQIYAHVVPPSEAWMEQHALSEFGHLPAPGPDFALRFHDPRASSA